MIRNALSVLSLLALLHVQNVMAHGGGHGPISEARAVSIGLYAANQFARADPGLEIGKLSISWTEVPRDAAKIHVKGEGYYIISVENKAEGKVLYVLMSANGDIYDANFTGEFPRVK